MASWESVVGLVGIAGSLGTAIGVGWKTAKERGRQEKRMDDIEKITGDNYSTLVSHTAQLADGDGKFKLLASKIEDVLRGQEDIKRGQETILGRLITHITGGRE